VDPFPSKALRNCPVKIEVQAPPVLRLQFGLVQAQVLLVQEWKVVLLQRPLIVVGMLLESLEAVHSLVLKMCYVEKNRLVKLALPLQAALDCNCLHLLLVVLLKVYY